MLLLMGLPNYAAFAQGTSAITGSVLTVDGRPVAGARVRAERGDRRDSAAHEAVSDERGAFRIGDLAAGIYTVSARRIGYRAAEIPALRVAVGQTATLRVTLSEAARQLSAIVVVTSPLAIDATTTELPSRVERQDIAVLPTGHDASSLIALVPGAHEDGHQHFARRAAQQLRVAAARCLQSEPERGWLRAGGEARSRRRTARAIDARSALLLCRRPACPARCQGAEPGDGRPRLSADPGRPSRRPLARQADLAARERRAGRRAGGAGVERRRPRRIERHRRPVVDASPDVVHLLLSGRVDAGARRPQHGGAQARGIHWARVAARICGPSGSGGRATPGRTSTDLSERRLR